VSARRAPYGAKTALLVAAVALAGCDKKEEASTKPDPYMRMLARGAELGEQMCACKDKPCADKVQAAYDTFAEAQTKVISADNRKPSVDYENRLAAVQRRLAECATKAALPPEPAKATPGTASTQRLDELIRSARERVGQRDKRLVLSKLVAAYVRADGALDKDYGKLELVFKMPPLKDDPKRPIGAPPPKPPPDNAKTDCPTWRLEAGKWDEVTGPCAPDKELAAAKCTVEQIWAKAIEDKAPNTALATLALDIVDGKQSWLFSIEDESRGVDIKKTYADDCAPQLEKPKP